MKKIISGFILFISIFILVGCEEFTTGGTVSILVDSYSIEVEEGDIVSISPTVVGSTNALVYTSSDETVFTVSNGVISGISEGSGELTIGVLNTQVFVTVSVTVTAVDDDPIDDDPIDDNPIVDPNNQTFVIANGDQNLVVGDVVNLQVLLGGAPISGTVSWMSGNIGVATVNTYGILTANAAGNASIIALYGNRSATINVVVRAEDVVVVNPTSLVISGSNFVNVSNQVLLTATPNQGVITGLVWSSSDISKATVNNFGIVTGVSVGVVTITATLTSDSSVSSSFTLLVKEAETSASPITSISITGANEVLAGNKIKLMVSYTPSTEPATFTYASSNTAIATVDSAGWVTGVAGGAVQITATLVGDTTKNASFSVTVIPLPEGITITGASSVSYNQNIVLTASAYPVGASSAVTWSSSDTTVASVDSNGRVTGLKVGSATITATSVVSSTIKATHTVTVTDQMSITLNPTSINLTTGGTATITATVVAASLTDKSVVWTSSNTSVATVSSSGVVTAVAAGSANIIAKLNANNTIQAQASITVSAPALPTITISDATASLLVGGTKTLTATVGNASNTSVTWTSNNTAVATVSTGGLVTAVKAGTATITATSNANTTVKATCVVTVTAPAAGTLTVTQSPTGSIAIGATGYQIYVNDSAGASVSRLECTFTSSNSSVATVSTYGTISALKAGSATITVAHPTKGTGTIVLTITSTTPPPQLPTASGTPSLVFTSPGADASTQMNISWHHTTSGGYLEYTKKTDTAYANKVKVAPVSNSATFASLSDGNSGGYTGTVSYYRKTVNLTGLTAATEYKYRIVGSSTSSDYYFKTASNSTFSFIYMSDVHAYPNISSRLTTANTLVTKAESKISGLGFVLFSGDLTSHGSDYYQWKHFNTAPFTKKYFVASVPGNHDYYKYSSGVVHTSDVYYNAMFNNPKNGASGISNSSYYFKYNNVLFVGINSEILDTTKRNTQKSWLSSVITNNPASFVIAFSHREFFHGSTVSAPSGVAKSADCYSIYGSTLESLGVDLVLSGDDHVYVRTKPIKSGAVTTADKGTIYITANQIGARGRIATSASTYSAKIYGGTTADNTVSSAQIITVSSTQITGQMFDPAGTVKDTYSIPKK